MEETKAKKWTASDTLVEAVKGFEGLLLTAYKDAGGVWTIGYGHTSGVCSGMECTPEQAEAWLREDLAEAGRYVLVEVTPETQGQYDALTDFVYNLGYGQFRGSTLLKRIKLGEPTEAIQKEFRRWVYCNGKVLNGLKTRREWEAQRWADTDKDTGKDTGKDAGADGEASSEGSAGKA